MTLNTNRQPGEIIQADDINAMATSINETKTSIDEFSSNLENLDGRLSSIRDLSPSESLLSAYKDDPQSDYHVAFLGDVSRVREWTEEYYTDFNPSVERVYQRWTGASWDKTSDAPGEGTPETGGTTFSEEFAAIVGSVVGYNNWYGTPDAWVFNYGTAVANSKGWMYNDFSEPIKSGGSVKVDFSVVTKFYEHQQILRIYFGSSKTKPSSGLMVGFSAFDPSGMGITLYKSIIGTTSSIGSLSNTLVRDSSTKQTLSIEIQRSGLDYTFVATSDDGTVSSVTHTLTQEEQDAIGSGIAIHNVSTTTSGAASDFFLERVVAKNPIVPSTVDSLLVSEYSGISMDSIAALSKTSAPDLFVILANPKGADHIIGELKKSYPNALFDVNGGQSIASEASSTDPIVPTVKESSLERLSAFRAFENGKLNVVLVSDSTGDGTTDWFRLWDQAVTPTFASNVRSVYNSWDFAASKWVTTVDQEGTPPDTGVIIDDTFSYTGLVSGQSPDTSGPAWGGGTGWQSDGNVARRVSGVTTSAITADMGSKDQTVEIDLLLSSPAGRSSTATFRVYAGSVWGQIAVSVTGRVTLDLWKYIAGTSTQIIASATEIQGTSVGMVDVPTKMTVNLSIQNAMAKVEVAGKTTEVRGVISESDYDQAYTTMTVMTGGGDPLPFALDRVQAWTGAKDIPTEPPTISFLNAAKGGGTLAIFDESTRDSMFSSLDVDVLIVSMGHNYQTAGGETFIATLSAWLDEWKAEHPSSAIMLVSQNPQFPPTANPIPHRMRQMALRAWAKSEGYDYVGIFERFNSLSDGGKSLIMPDGVHPSVPPSGTTAGDYGSVFWAGEFEKIVSQF